MAVNVDHIRQFIQFAKQELQLPTLPQISLVGSSENKFNAFGHSQGAQIVCRVTDRHPVDIMRTLAHELIHYKQNILKLRGSSDAKEDQANLLAGRLMRKFDIANPDIFRDKAIRANMINEDALGVAPVNAMGSSSSIAGAGGIDTFDPFLLRRERKAKALRKAIKNSSK
jgi:hypothetical protein